MLHEGLNFVRWKCGQGLACEVHNVVQMPLECSQIPLSLRTVHSSETGIDL